MQRNRFVRTVGVMILLFVLTTAMYAFTAQNTFDGDTAGNAGIGDSTVGGYEVSDISYTFAEDASDIASVEFNLDAPADSVQARANGTGDWVVCATTGASPAWTCPIDTDTLELESLEVAAAD